MFGAKVMILGAAAVGKSALAKRLAFDRFDEVHRSTVGVNILSHEMILGPDCANAALRLIMWDTDGNFESHIFTGAHVAGAAGAVIVSDATRPDTMLAAIDFGGRFAGRFPGRPVRIVINKTDLVDSEGPVATPDFSPHRPLFASARNGDGVHDAFRAIGEDIWRRGLAH